MRFIYIKKCNFCGRPIKEDKVICNDCLDSIKVIGEDTCERCGADKLNCECKTGDFAFDSNISSFYYQGCVRVAVIRLKFRKRPQMSKIIAGYIANGISDKYKDFTFDFVTFVPASRIKRAFKGYDPVEIIADRVAESVNLPLINCLKSKFVFVPQKELKGKARLRAVKGRFSVCKDVKDKNILLIDDVMTSGATLSECSRMLKSKGAKTVRCATFAISKKTID